MKRRDFLKLIGVAPCAGFLGNLESAKNFSHFVPVQKYVGENLPDDECQFGSQFQIGILNADAILTAEEIDEAGEILLKDENTRCTGNWLVAENLLVKEELDAEAFAQATRVKFRGTTYIYVSDLLGKAQA